MGTSPIEPSRNEESKDVSCVPTVILKRVQWRLPSMLGTAIESQCLWPKTPSQNLIIIVANVEHYYTRYCGSSTKVFYIDWLPLHWTGVVLHHCGARYLDVCDTPSVIKQSWVYRTSPQLSPCDLPHVKIPLGPLGKFDSYCIANE